MKTNLTVFLDMDGVLCDLKSGMIDFTGDTNIESNRGKLFDEYLPRYVDAEGFYTQGVLRNADVLVDNLLKMDKNGSIKLAILTSIGMFYKPGSKIVDQKKRWIEKNFPKLANVPFCTTSGGREKSRLAHPNAILIDDHLPNIEAFIREGGMGYHYDSPFKCEGAIEFVEEIVIQY